MIMNRISQMLSLYTGKSLLKTRRGGFNMNSPEFKLGENELVIENGARCEN